LKVEGGSERIVDKGGRNDSNILTGSELRERECRHRRNATRSELRAKHNCPGERLHRII
jgi:hypothetical protein